MSTKHTGNSSQASHSGISKRTRGLSQVKWTEKSNSLRRFRNKSTISSQLIGIIIRSRTLIRRNHSRPSALVNYQTSTNWRRRSMNTFALIAAVIESLEMLARLPVVSILWRYLPTHRMRTSLSLLSRKLQRCGSSSKVSYVAASRRLWSARLTITASFHIREQEKVTIQMPACRKSREKVL